MNNKRALLFASVAATVVALAGAAGITALANSSASPIHVAASPSPTFKSNEDPTHEKGESAAQEAAENNGTFHPGPGGGPSNEDPAHEASESASHEAAEKS